MTTSAPRGYPRLIVPIAIIVIIISVASVAVIYAESGGNDAASSTNSSRSETTTVSSEGNGSSQVPEAVDCVTVVPYDAIQVQRQFAGCGYTFSVPFNGAPFDQTLPNGSVEENSGWTLLIEVSQNCRCGPNENTSFGWDPGGPGGYGGSSERLPVPAATTLLDGNVTIQWRLYNTNDTPKLYAWVSASSLPSSQTTASNSTSTSCPVSTWPSQASTSYQPIVQQIEQNPAFNALRDGLCYSFTLNYSGEAQGQSLNTFVFNEYNGTVVQYCGGEFAEPLILSQIQVTLAASGNDTGEIVAMDLDNQSGDLNISSCPIASMSSTATTTSSTTTTCVQLESEPLYLIIRNSTTGNPIGAVPVQVNESTPLDLCSPGGGNSTKNLGTIDTNANGTIEVCCTGSTFAFSIAYLGANYQVNSTAEGAESVQCVTLYIPSGVTNTTFGPQFQDHC